MNISIRDEDEKDRESNSSQIHFFGSFESITNETNVTKTFLDTVIPSFGNRSLTQLSPTVKKMSSIASGERIC
jgi:hypothetical protein